MKSASRKLSLGHKQLEENPWDGYAKQFIEGKDLIDIGLNVKKWLFWPQYPMIIEKN